MKLTGREAARFCRSPDLSLCGALIHGADAGQVAAARQQIVSAVLGDDGDDLRISRMDAAEARKDASAIDTALRERGFFPGRRVAVIEGGTDGLTAPLDAALEGITQDDAFLVVTAGVLPARSKLRKLFEGQGNLVGLQLFQNAPDARDIAGMLTERDVTAQATDDALQALADVARGMDHGSFAQLVDVIALFSMDRAEPLDLDAVMGLVPAGLDAELDAFVDAVASGAPRAIGPLIQRLSAGGTTPVSMLIALQRHFRQLLQAGSAPGGPDMGLASLRPPAWGPRRDAMSRQLRQWGQGRLEQANRALFEADRTVRSAGQSPDLALVERCALRLAIMGSLKKKPAVDCWPVT